MIHLPVEQGSVAWLEARLGIPTASHFDRIITPSGKPSSQAEGYRHDLLAEWALGYSLDEDLASLPAVERGTALEPDAFDFYELIRDTTVSPGGFCLLDDRTAGCSPDGLVGADGALELKCPKPGTHIGYLLGPAGERYKHQIQGGLWITGREWWDFMSYHPELPPALVRVTRDEPYIRALATLVRAFTEQLEEAKVRLQQAGVVPRVVGALAEVAG